MSITLGDQRVEGGGGDDMDPNGKDWAGRITHCALSILE